MALYPYQKRVKEHLLNGRSVVLQAPTGSGKTRAALAPFVEAFFTLPDDAFPRQALYSVPMRVLAAQFERETKEMADRFYRTHRARLGVTIQTGERPEDPELAGDLIFATLDQVLSSAIGVPYSLSSGRANLNVGAVIGSYLVFDEFHLFPREATKTTLQLLRSYSGIVPFTLMTATFSRKMLDGIADALGAEVVYPGSEEIEAIATAGGALPRKSREFRVVSHTLTAEDVLSTHDRRSLVVCNTVDRAVSLYRELVASGCDPLPLDSPDLERIYRELRTSSGEKHDRLKDEAVGILREIMNADKRPWALLLHSRFERPHRQVKEALVQSLWSSDAVNRGGTPSLILVATQVVEVGLDISAQVLHTEIAPASSVFQRAGRCARFPGEKGRVFVYMVPETKDGRPNYAPYASSKVEQEICEKSWKALNERSGSVLRFHEEQEVIDEAHGEADEALLREIREDEWRIWELIGDALVYGEVGSRRELIRKVNSRSIIVYDAPYGLTEESPYRYEGFSLWHGSLRGKVKKLMALAEELNLGWALRYPKAISEEEESRQPVVYRWSDVQDEQEIDLSLLFAVNPRLADYTPEIGFRLAEAGKGEYRSPLAARRSVGRKDFSYSLESYPDHIRKMLKVFDGTPKVVDHWRGGSLHRRLAWLERKFAEIDGDEHVSKGLLDRAVRLGMALHDVGKLDKGWQAWAAAYQEAIGEGKPPFLVVHTHYDPENPVHQKAYRRTRRKKPKTHAAEGAIASMKLLMKHLDGNPEGRLYRTVVMAILRHHSPQAEDGQAFELHPKARSAVEEALAAAGGESWRPWAEDLILKLGSAPDIRRWMLAVPPEEHWLWWFVYFVVVRNLRLCDNLSQEVK